MECEITRDIPVRLKALRMGWSAENVVRMDSATRKTILPADWDDSADDELYDDLV